MKMEVLAQRANLAVGTVSGIETGKKGYTRDSLEAIARALSTRPGYLFEFDLNVHHVITIWLSENLESFL